jgi:hypothetical protein
MITIYGASDDLIEVAGCEGADEFNNDDWSADLIAPDDSQMSVWCWYTLGGTWAVGVAQTDEEHPLPAWPIAITQAPAMNPDNPGYSVLLSIDAPEGTRLASLKGAHR